MPGQRVLSAQIMCFPATYTFTQPPDDQISQSLQQRVGDLVIRTLMNHGRMDLLRGHPLPTQHLAWMTEHILRFNAFQFKVSRAVPSASPERIASYVSCLGMHYSLGSPESSHPARCGTLPMTHFLANFPMLLFNKLTPVQRWIGLVHSNRP